MNKSNNPNLISQSDTREREAEDLKKLLVGNFEFRKDLRISEQSKYGDDVWTWVDRSDPHLVVYSPYRLTLDWPKLLKEYLLTPEIISDLKRFAFLRLTHSRAIFGSKSAHNNAHPATVITQVNCLALFLSHLRSSLSGEGYSLINRLSDIELDDIRNALASYKRRQLETIKNSLHHLGSPNLSSLLEFGPLKWNNFDINTLRWRLKDRRHFDRLPDEMFRFLSNSSTSDVKHFLQALKIQTEDRTPIGEGENTVLLALPNFAELYEKYIHARHALSDFGSLSTQYQSLRGQTKLSPLHRIVDRTRKASQLLIAMYTGARLSELNSFKCDCVRRQGDEWVLVGTELKGRGRWVPTLQDQWVAIPILRDAVTALNQIARVTRVDYLFHGSKRNGTGTRSGSGSFRNWFESYLETIDEEKRWTGTRIHTHMFRHTLVFQLRRAELGLPFITFQLKHYSDGLNRKVSNITTMYGGLTSEAAQKAVVDANKDFITQVYHPNARVAGGGADEHKARRAAYFAGLALRGVTVDDALNELAKQGMPLTDVGLGLCQGQRKIVVDGIRDDPPCIGQLRCNPNRCAQAVIPRYKAPAWERLSRENKLRANDPQLSHARSYLLEAAAEADQVLEILNEN